ncbi:MAG: WD40 repeat domain-containing protein [Candidatus Methylacidiphilales bacterium]|nr:WD40 repeat domain-containing protein [Candidatus Methylacidiphilales bacterium]
MNKFQYLVILSVFLTGAPLQAVQTTRILIDSFSDWAEGRPQGTAVVEPGRLSTAPSFAPVAELKSAVLWAGALERNGSVLLAAGKPGAVWRLTPSGRLDKLTEFQEPDVYAVASGPKGEVYAAPSPGGKIFRLGDQGRFEEFYQTGEDFVWDLKVSPSGVLFAATGTKGKIHRITGKGQGQVWFDSDEAHIRCLAFDSGGNLLAGSSGRGLLYRITGRDQGVVLLDSGKDEIAALAVDSTGRIFAAASSGTGGSGGGGSSPERPRSARPAITLETDGESPLSSVAASSSTPGSDSVRSPAGSCTTDLYVLGRDLSPQKLREFKDDIAALAVSGNKTYAASAADGRMYQVNDGREIALLGGIEKQPVIALLGQGGILTALSQGRSRVWRSGPEGGGTYQSRVMDSKTFARWGAFRAQGEGDWTVRTRSGNTSDPDKSWYPWMPLDGGKIASPQARYLQFEVKLERGSLEQVEVFLLPVNQPPRIDLLRVLEPDTAYEVMLQPAPPPQPQGADQLAKGADGPPLPPARFQPSTVRGARSAAWQASDPNGDRLRFAVYLKREGEGAWELLEKEWLQPVFSWDASGWPDGAYRFRVVADDGLDNPEEGTLQTEKISEALTVDHTPPSAVIVRKTPLLVEIAVSDQTSAIAAAYCSTNGHDFEPLLPADGINDSLRETFLLRRKEGATLFFRVEDSHGNVTGLRILPD